MAIAAIRAAGTSVVAASPARKHVNRSTAYDWVVEASASSCSLERVIRVADLGSGGESGFRSGALVAPADVVADGGVLFGARRHAN